jgi:short-subunit dehydrogenase
MKSNPFRGQVVIVTGASSGIGRAIALQLAAHGANLAIAARRADRLEQVAEECRQLGGDVLVIPADVSDEAQCKCLVERTVAAYGRLDMLINNAGMAATALFADFPDLRLFKHTMDVNFYGSVHCTYHAVPYLRRTSGRIVAISSVGGKAAIPYSTAYNASKFALHGFFDALRMELRQHRVSVTMICPWWVASEFHPAQLDKNGVPVGPRGREIYTARMMSSERCAKLILKAAQKRRREVWMGLGGLAAWLKLLAPGLLDWLVIKVFLGPAIRRHKGSIP